MKFDALTTEKLKKLFKNNFDLCNFAIEIGRSSVMSNSQSTLRDILQEIQRRAEERPQ